MKPLHERIRPQNYEDQSNQVALQHRVNYGRLWPDTLYKADCACGWSSGATSRETMLADMRKHKDLFKGPP